jgi:hypothetical protein
MGGFSFGKYKDNLSLTLIALGGPLLIASLLALVAEMWLRSRAAPGSAIGPTSLWGTVLLALAVTRLVLPIVGGLVAIPALVSRLLHKLYATKDLSEAHDTLNRLVFGPLGFRPYLRISGGKVASGGDTPLGQVGGPCWMLVYNDSAVITEQYGRLKRVLGAGFHKLERFERVWEVIDLRPQRWVVEVSGLTKEGIPVSCEADVSFKIDDRIRDADGREQIKGTSHKEPYPYTEEAVFRAANSKWIRDPEQEEARRTWAGRVVIGLTDGILRGILAEYRLDWLLAPPQPDQPHPREEIRQRLEAELQKAASNVGARVLDVQLGAIEVKARDAEVTKRLSEIVSKQWIEAWQADWERRALLSKVEGEAELLRMDMARIQAQAEMAVILTETLQATIADHRAVQPYILALRFVEALHWMSYNTYTREFMPPEALRTLKQLRDVLEGREETDERPKRWRLELKEGNEE